MANIFLLYLHMCYSLIVLQLTVFVPFIGSIPPLEGERYWPRVVSHIEPPPIKIGPGRPRKNRRKDPFEDPKKPGRLTRTGMEMTCTICQVKGHNKRTCPQKDTSAPHIPNPPNRAKGRPRNDGQPPQSRKATTLTTSTQAHGHHSVTAQPSQLGRSGRMVRGGIGSRGGRRGSTRGGSRGRGRGRNDIPKGVGVLFDADGGITTTTSRNEVATGSSQVSTAHQQT